MITQDDLREFCKKAFDLDKSSIALMLQSEPYASHLIETLSYKYFNEHTMWYQLCHCEFEDIFLSLAPQVPKELWLARTSYGANMLMKALVSNSIHIFNCVYDTGLFKLDDIISLAIASNSKHIIQRIDELGGNYSQSFLFDWVEDQFYIMNHQGQSILSFEAIEEVFNPKYHVNFHLTDKDGNNLIHKVVSSKAHDEDNIIKVLQLAMTHGVNILSVNSENKTILDLCCADHVPRKEVIHFLLSLKEFENISLLEKTAFNNTHDTIFFQGSERQKMIFDYIQILREKNKLNQNLIESTTSKKIKL